jgi:hypothetical protein
MSKSHSITIHRVFEVYQYIFDNIEYQSEKLKNKWMGWKMEIRDALDKALDMAKSCYGKRERSSGLLHGFSTCLNPYRKLELFKGYDEDEDNDPHIKALRQQCTDINL